MVSLLWVKQEFTSGMSVSKMVVKTLKMTKAPEAWAHQQLMKKWTNWKKWLWTIAESQSEKLLMMLAYRLAHAMKFFSNILGMKRVAAKFVPKLLNFEQKQRRMELAQDSLNEVNDDAELLKRIITGDETWVHGYDVETNLIQILWSIYFEKRKSPST